jgi:4-methyl-5(b-hydroxyethyl)-thiazole monophosphate biosynthesis
LLIYISICIYITIGFSCGFMNILVPLVNGFEEIEAISVVDVLRRAGFNVVIAGIPNTMLIGDSGLKMIADCKIDNISPEQFQAIVLPGGSGYARLGQSKKVMEMLRDFNQKNKLIAAICFSPVLLAKEGLLDNRRATVYPGKERELPKPRGERVVVDGNIITSQGPGTAMEFALKIVETLAGKPKAESLRKGLVCR